MLRNNFHRFQTAVIQDGIPDRVPLGENDIDVSIMEAYLGKPVIDLKTYVEFWKQAGYDYVLVEIRNQYLADSYQKKITEGVRKRHAHHADDAASVSTSGSTIFDEESFLSYPWFKKDDIYYKDIDLIGNYLPAEMKVILCIGPIYNGIQRAMGMDAFVTAYARNRDLISSVAEKFGASAVRIVENVLQREWVGGVWLGDDIACKTGLMISPEFLREYVFPYYRKIGDLCKYHKKLYIFHSDGDRTAIFPDLVDFGVQAVHPNEPLSGDIYAMKKEWGSSFAFIGNIDVDLLERGTPEEVSIASKRLLAQLSSGGGFILGSGNSITEHTPIENYRAMIRSVLDV